MSNIRKALRAKGKDGIVKKIIIIGSGGVGGGEEGEENSLSLVCSTQWLRQFAVTKTRPVERKKNPLLTPCKSP